LFVFSESQNSTFNENNLSLENYFIYASVKSNDSLHSAVHIEGSSLLLKGCLNLDMDETVCARGVFTVICQVLRRAGTES